MLRIGSRRCVAVAGSMTAFQALNIVDLFADAARFDRFLFAYASPAIAVLIGLVYADVSRQLLARLRWESETSKLQQLEQSNRKDLEAR